nr:hypothetical protein [Chloroflexota bacterium]
DFVVVLYNPASARRRQGLARAQTLLLEQRPPVTPVGVVRDAERPEQSVEITTLGRLLEHLIDMRTIVVVGNSATVRLGDRLVTRRGYGSAPAAADDRSRSSGDG